MNNPEIFRPRHVSEIDRMVAAYPLALVISACDGEIQASPLPLVLQRDDDGQGTLIGHLSRANPQLELMRRNGRALVTFSGAQGYISSSWLRERRYAPTWNYEAVHFTVEITLEEQAGAIEQALQTLITHVEAPFPQPWSGAEMGPRLTELAKFIIPFRARILDTQAQFKLGQGDSQAQLDDAYAGLERYGKLELATAMRRLHAMGAD